MYKYLLNERVILLTGRVDEKMATQAVQVSFYTCFWASLVSDLS